MYTQEIEAFVNSFRAAIEEAGTPDNVFRLSRFIRNAAERGGTVYFLGNGASASISSTLAFKCLAEHSISALALTDHNLLLGMSRKGTFATWMADSLQTLLKPNDALFLTSSSGESPNVVNAAELAAEIGVPTFSVTGFAQDNRLRGLTSDELWVDSTNYNVVESAHLFIGLMALRGVHSSDEEVSQDHAYCLRELFHVDWKERIKSLAEYSVDLAARNYDENRIVFIGDGSSASLASHLATDFSKSTLTAQAINDHSFLSASQNDFGSTEWLNVGFDRSYRPGDEIILITHSTLFPAEIALLRRLHDSDISFSYHGTQETEIDVPDGRKFLYPVSHPVNELVLPSIGLLAVAEAFL